jgi:thymidylate synthase
VKQYLEMLEHVLQNGQMRPTRAKLLSTGKNVDALTVFGYQYRHNLSEGFPLLTTKKVSFKSIVYELIWFLRGDTNIKYLQDNGVHIWDEWADENGDIGAAYGKQWRKWESWELDEIRNTSENAFYPLIKTCKLVEHDQIKNIIDGINAIKKNPEASIGRRLILSAWNVGELDQMRLLPCHCLAQFDVFNNTLSCQLYQRSADAFLGVPYNIASYALLTHLIAHITNLQVGEFIHTFGNLHIYENHIEQVKEQLNRPLLPLPNLQLRNILKFDNYLQQVSIDDIQVINYRSAGPLKGEVAV